jgi:hypothetical protein
MTHWWQVSLVAVGLYVTLTPGFAHAMLSMSEIDALAALRAGNATEAQRAIAFARNDAINRARLNGYISDDVYQAAQKDFAALNEDFAAAAAKKAGAEFTVQKRTSQTFSPGTDSDYITKVKSADDVKRMQRGYNERINKYLKENLKNTEYAGTQRADWHNRLDTDFMADPKHVSKAEFEEIAKINNDAYKRQPSATYEASSRAGDGTKVSPEEFRAYGTEMRDLAKKKQRMLAKLRENPMLMDSPHWRAEYHKIMAQEQKYISRIESATAALRAQEGLPPRTRGDLWEVVQDKDGKWMMKQKDSIAKIGSKRSPTNFGRTVAGHAVGDNSMNRALEELADSYADAAAKNPKFRAKAASDMAELMESLPPSQKGAMIDALKQRHGADFAQDVAGALRGNTRSALRKWAGRAMRGLQGVGVAADVYFAAQYANEYLDNFMKALDPDLTEAEAAVYFEKAQAAAHGLSLTGGLGVLMEYDPRFAALFGVYTISRLGLENTETGEQIDQWAVGLWDRHMQAAEHFSCDAAEFLGYQSECERLEEHERAVLAAFMRAIEEGRIEPVDMDELWELIQEGRFGDIKSLVKVGPKLLAARKASAALAGDAAALEALCDGMAAELPAGERSAEEAVRVAQGVADTIEDISAQLASIDDAARACAGLGDVRTAARETARNATRWGQRAREGHEGAQRRLRECASPESIGEARTLADLTSKLVGNAAEKYALAREGERVMDEIEADAKAGQEQLGLVGNAVAALAVNRRTAKRFAETADTALAKIEAIRERCSGGRDALASAVDALVAQYPFGENMAEIASLRERLDGLPAAPDTERVVADLAEAEALAVSPNGFAPEAALSTARSGLAACRAQAPFEELLAAGEAMLGLDGATEWAAEIDALEATCQAKLGISEGAIAGTGAGGASEPAGCSPTQIAGTYRASYGPIHCKAGEGLECSYGGSGQWSLHLRLALSSDGQKLEGTWDHNDGRTGPVEFGLNERCELSSGRYGYKAGQLTVGWSVSGKSQKEVADSNKCKSFCVEWACGITGTGCAKIGNSCDGDTRRDTSGGNFCGKGCKQAC